MFNSSTWFWIIYFHTLQRPKHGKIPNLYQNINLVVSIFRITKENKSMSVQNDSQEQFRFAKLIFSSKLKKRLINDVNLGCEPTDD